jgi:hypothetical protein
LREEGEKAAEPGGILRRALWACELAGLAATYFAKEAGHQTWLAAALLFGLALASTVVGWSTARARQFGRQGTDRRGEKPRLFQKWSFMSHWTWDSFATALVTMGAILLALGFIR